MWLMICCITTEKYLVEYTDKEKRQFERRVERRIDASDAVAFKNFLAMYANPVCNKEKLNVKAKYIINLYWWYHRYG